MFWVPEKSELKENVARKSGDFSLQLVSCRAKETGVSLNTSFYLSVAPKFVKSDFSMLSFME